MEQSYPDSNFMSTLSKYGIYYLGYFAEWLKMETSFQNKRLRMLSLVCLAAMPNHAVQGTLRDKAAQRP